MTQGDERMDEWLRQRRAVPPSGDLAARIILAAEAVAQKRGLRPGEWLQGLFAAPWLPRPAYVLATALCLGFILGFSAPAQVTAETSAEQAYFYDGGEIL